MTISSLVSELEKRYKIPLSTLKLNAKILRNLNLISYGNNSAARLTAFGRLVAKVISNGSESVTPTCLRPLPKSKNLKGEVGN